jgi:aryl-alcohol dehydrogenase-like predicted oxidoreductase
VQLEYSLLERTAEGELFPMAQEMSIGIMPWSPLKHGFLSGKFRRENRFSRYQAHRDGRSKRDGLSRH